MYKSEHEWVYAPEKFMKDFDNAILKEIKNHEYLS